MKQLRFKLNYRFIHCRKDSVRDKARRGFRREWWAVEYKWRCK